MGEKEGGRGHSEILGKANDMSSAMLAGSCILRDEATATPELLGGHLGD